jgi:hypothetical protein
MTFFKNKQIFNTLIQYQYSESFKEVNIAITSKTVSIHNFNKIVTDCICHKSVELVWFGKEKHNIRVFKKKKEKKKEKNYEIMK